MNEERDAQEIHAYVDGELDLVRQLAFERALENDAVLGARVAAVRNVRRQVREQATFHGAPETLRRRIEQLTGNEDATRDDRRRARGTTARTPPASGGTIRRWFAWRPLSVGLATAFVVGFGVQTYVSEQRQDDSLTADIVASHVRSTVGEHLIDVASSDHHTVKPWLSSKLGFSPPVRDTRLGTAVFVGGRVDYVNGRPVAALVYRQGEHVVNAFVWPGDAARGPIEFSSRRGYQIAHWSRDGMTHWIISDVNRTEFADFVNLLAAPDSPAAS